MSPAHGFFYLAMLKNISQCWALYCLVYFEHSCADLLKPINPLPKFWSIKLVVLATFWQSIAISIMSSSGALPWTAYYQECYIPYLTTTDDGHDRMSRMSINPPAACHPWCNDNVELNVLENVLTEFCLVPATDDTSDVEKLHKKWCDPTIKLCACPDQVFSYVYSRK